MSFVHNGISYEGVDFNDPSWGLFGAEPTGDFTMSVVNGQLIITDESVKAASGFDFELRPSVATDFTNVVISTEKAVDAQLSLSDMNGSVLNTRTLKGVQNGTVVTLETSELAAGLYIVSIRNEEGAVAKKLVVVK